MRTCAGGPDIPCPMTGSATASCSRSRIREAGDSIRRQALRADVPAEYMNSPETDLFHKSRRAVQLRAGSPSPPCQVPVIAAEGYMDVIALHQAGFRQRGPPARDSAHPKTSSTPVAHGTTAPTLCFDGDKAARRRPGGAADLALAGLKPGRTVRFACCPRVATRMTLSARAARRLPGRAR